MSQRGIKISVVIPTYNRPEALSKCLQALERQTLDEDWEVLVVDDGGETDLEQVVLMFEHRLNVILLKQENSGPATARNNGVQKARGEYIAFLDDDCEPTETWLQELLEHAKSGVMVGGKTENILQKNLYSETSQILVSYLYQRFENTPWHFFTSNNFLVDKHTFLKVGGFDESFTTSAGEDRELCLRWRQSGGEMLYNEKAVIWHAHYQTFRSFWQMHFKYGKAAYLFDRKLRDLKTEPLKPKLSFYLALFGFVWKYDSPHFKKRFNTVFLTLASQLATFFGFLKIRLITLFQPT